MKKTKAQKKIGKVMREFKKGKLHSGMSKKIVTNPKQAVAIALSEAGKSKKMMSGGMSDGVASKGFGIEQKRGGGIANGGMGMALAAGGQVSGGPKSKQMRMHHKMALGMKFMMKGGQVRGVGAGKMRGTRAALKGTDFKGVF